MTKKGEDRDAACVVGWPHPCAGPLGERIGCRTPADRHRLRSAPHLPLGVEGMQSPAGVCGGGGPPPQMPRSRGKRSRSRGKRSRSRGKRSRTRGKRSRSRGKRSRTRGKRSRSRGVRSGGPPPQTARQRPIHHRGHRAHGEKAEQRAVAAMTPNGEDRDAARGQRGSGPAPTPTPAPAAPSPR